MSIRIQKDYACVCSLGKRDVQIRACKSELGLLIALLAVVCIASMIHDHCREIKVSLDERKSMMSRLLFHCAAEREKQDTREL